MNNPRVFDYQHYELLNRARGRVVRELLDQLSQSLRLRTAVDVGCGLGYFSEMLNSLGLQVVGADGRKENAEEASRRVPTVNFHTMNAEDIEIRSLGIFDLCFCFGLLYHLENPFIAIRHLHAMTRSLLLVEGLIYPGDEPIMGLVEETPFEDQGLRHYAFYPTEACLVKMMYLAGFANVYRIAKAPDHPGYSRRGEAPKKRTILGGFTRAFDLFSACAGCRTCQCDKTVGRASGKQDDDIEASCVCNQTASPEGRVDQKVCARKMSET